MAVPMHYHAALRAELSAQSKALADYQKKSEKGAANGYASLDPNGDVPDAQISASIARDNELHPESHSHASHTGIGASDHHTAFVQADHDALANPHHNNADDHSATPAHHEAESGQSVTHTHATHDTPHANDHAQAHTHPESEVTFAAAGHEHTGTTQGNLIPTAGIEDNAVSNVKAADMAQALIKGRAVGAGTGDPTDLTPAQATAILDAFTSALKGLAPASGGGTTNFLRADGTWAAPSGGPGGAAFTLIALTEDVVNNNATANTLQDVTGLSFAVTAGKTYLFRFYILYTSAASTTGSRWTLNGPAATFLIYTSRYTLTATTQTLNAMLTAYSLPALSNATSNVSNGGGNMAIIEGIIRPSANGTVIARFASEVANSAITAKVGSLLEWREAA